MGSDEAVPAPSVFHSREPGVSGNFLGSHEGCQVPFRPSGRNRGLPLRRRRGQGPHLAKRWEPRGFSLDTEHRALLEKQRLEAERGIGLVRHVAPPTWLVSNVLV